MGGGGGTPGKKLLHPENFRPETYNSQQGPPFTGCRQPRVYENKLPIDLSNLVQGCTERGKGSDVIREAARPKKCILPAARQSGFPIYICVLTFTYRPFFVAALESVTLIPDTCSVQVSLPPPPSFSSLLHICGTLCQNSFSSSQKNQVCPDWSGCNGIFPAFLDTSISGPETRYIPLHLLQPRDRPGFYAENLIIFRTV